MNGAFLSSPPGQKPFQLILLLSYMDNPPGPLMEHKM